MICDLTHIKILIKHGMTSCDIIGTPMATKHLDADLRGTPVIQMKYRSMVGALMYLTASRLDIVHATCYCARYQAKPTEKHVTAVKRIFWYLKDTINMGLWYPKDTSFELTAFSDSDHAGCLDSRKSTSGGIQFLGGDIEDGNPARANIKQALGSPYETGGTKSVLQPRSSEVGFINHMLILKLSNSNKESIIGKDLILNGDSPLPTRSVEGVETPYPPTTVEEKLDRKNELKARGTLLISLPNENQLKFNSYKTAKSLIKAIEKRFGDNKESKKKTHTLIWRNKPDLETLSMDDLYNNLKIYKSEVMGSSSTTQNTQNIAFVSFNNTDSTNKAVNTSHGVSAASSKTNASNLPNKIPTENKKESRKYKASKHQDNKNREAPRRTVPAEETTSNALVSQCEGYHAVPPPYTGNYMPPKPNLVLADEHVISESVTSLPDWVYVSEDEYKIEIETKQIKHSFAKVKFVKSTEHVKSLRKSVKQEECNRQTKYPRKNSQSPRDYQEINGGFIAFGEIPKMGKIRTEKLDFEDVYCVKELKFNLFFVSQICDKKNSVLFTKTECLVLSSDFKLLDENQVLLKNRGLVTKHHNKTPYELLIGRSPNIDFMKPFGCPITILNTLDHLGKFKRKADEGFLVGYFVISKAFRVFNSRTRKVKENLHIRFLENKSNVAGSGPKWLFDIDSLTKSMNYEPVTAANQTNNDAGIEINVNAGEARQKKAFDYEYILLPFMPSNSPLSLSTQSSDDKDVDEVPSKGDECVSKGRGIDDQERTDISTQDVNTVGPSINIANTTINTGSLNINIVGSNDPSMPSLEETSIFDDVYDDREVGAEVDTNNLELLTVVSHIPTTRVNKDHPKKHIIGDLNLATQIRRMINFSKEMVMVSYINK
nr:ribonuclease H-like domain-containing protein [Tanacetum cinerariifolium]